MTTNSRTVRRLVLAAAALALAVPLAQALAIAQGRALAADQEWRGDRVQGNGNIKQQTRQLGHFSGVSLALPASLVLRIDNTEGVTIETDDNLLPLIETVIENGTLKIRPVRHKLQLAARSMKIVVHARQVERLALGGAGSIEADPLHAARLQFDLGGSGSIKLKGIDAETVSVTLGGSGNLDSAAGTARRLSVTVGGSGAVQLGKVKAAEASVNLAGSGDATVSARDSLSVTIAGSGDVNYYGDPKVSKTSVGSGGVRRLGAAPR
jgi:hypothetical protein